MHSFHKTLGPHSRGTAGGSRLPHGTARRLGFESLEARQLLTTTPTPVPAPAVVPTTEPFTFVNNMTVDTKGDLAYSDDEITMAIYCTNVAGNEDYYFDAAGNAISTTPGGPGTAPDIADVPTFKLDAIAGGDHAAHSYTINLPTSLPDTGGTGPTSVRVYFSLNNPAQPNPTPFVLSVNPDGTINGPDVDDGFVDFIEFSMNEPAPPTGNINIDTSNVDQISIPFQISVNATPTPSPSTVGIGVTRADVFTQFQAFTSKTANDPYATLISTATDPTYGPYRIQNPTDVLKALPEQSNSLQVMTQTLNSLTASASDTSLQVKDASPFVGPGNFSPFQITIDGETMTVTASTLNIDGTSTWTVTRGATPTAHAHGSTVTPAGSLMSATTDLITLAAVPGFPTTFPFNIQVDSEIMTVTGLLPSEIANGTNKNNDGTTTWLVQRGQFGTTATTHQVDTVGLVPSASAIYAPVTTSPLNTLFNQSIDELFNYYASGSHTISLSTDGSGTTETYQSIGVVQNSTGNWVLRFQDISNPSDTTDYDILYPFFNQNKLLWAGYTPMNPQWVTNAPSSTDWVGYTAGSDVDVLSPTQMVFGCNGVFADNKFREGGPTAPQGDNYTASEAKVLANLEDQVVSALNRGVGLSDSSNWQTVSDFWGADGKGQAWNEYAQFVHATPSMGISGVPGVSLNGQNYGFAFDDLANQASDISVASFTGATITLTPWADGTSPPGPPNPPNPGGGISQRSYLASTPPPTGSQSQVGSSVPQPGAVLNPAIVDAILASTPAPTPTPKPTPPPTPAPTVVSKPAVTPAPKVVAPPPPPVFSVRGFMARP